MKQSRSLLTWFIDIFLQNAPPSLSCSGFYTFLKLRVLLDYLAITLHNLAANLITSSTLDSPLPSPGLRTFLVQRRQYFYSYLFKPVHVSLDYANTASPSFYAWKLQRIRDFSKFHTAALFTLVTQPVPACHMTNFWRRWLAASFAAFLGQSLGRYSFVLPFSCRSLWTFRS